MTERRRLIELGKDILIVLLTISALWLAGRNQMLGPLTRLINGEETQLPVAGQTAGKDLWEGIRPLRIAARLPGEEESAICGILYEEAACDTLFGQVAGVLAETLTGAVTPEAVTREDWENTLRQRPGLMLDFQGQIPLSVLSGWLTGTPILLNSPVRRVLLAAEADGVSLTYRDEETGWYQRIRSREASPDRLLEALSPLTENGAFYAFQSDTYSDLDPDTLLPANPPVLPVCAASNAAGGGRSSLEELMENLELPVNANGIYRGADSEWVARSGSGTLRLSDWGVAVYEAGEGAEDRFSLGSDPSLYEQVDTCRRLTFSALSGRVGQGRLGLISVREMDQGLEVRFGVSLNAVPVVSSEASAARFLIRDGRIERFELVLRSYTATEEVTMVLPPRQALAALEAEQLSGAELQLIYRDTGADRVEVSWAAAGAGTGEG